MPTSQKTPAPFLFLTPRITRAGADRTSSRLRTFARSIQLPFHFTSLLLSCAATHHLPLVLVSVIFLGFTQSVAESIQDGAPFRVQGATRRGTPLAGVHSRLGEVVANSEAARRQPSQRPAQAAARGGVSIPSERHMRQREARARRGSPCLLVLRPSPKRALR